MEKALVIIGAGILQTPLIKEAAVQGYIPLICDMNPQAPGFNSTTEYEKIIVSTKDEIGVVNQIKRFVSTYKMCGVLTVGTDMSRTVARVAEEFNLIGNSYDVAKKTTNKLLMRDVLRERGVSQPKYYSCPTLNSLYDVLDKNSGINKQWIIKPADNMGARGVILLNESTTLSDMEQYFNEALNFSSDGAIICEEYIRSFELSIDALVQKGKVYIAGVADRFISNPPHFVEYGHLMPSILPQDLVNEAIRVFSEGVKALGIANGAAKGDIRVRYEKDNETKQKKPVAYVGEIASRLSGGFMSAYTFPYAYGINLMKNIIYVHTSEKNLDIKPQWNFYSCEMSKIPKKLGILDKVDGVYEAKMIPHVKNVFITKKSGDNLVFVTNNVTKLGHVISQASRASEAIRACKSALKIINYSVCDK